MVIWHPRNGGALGGVRPIHIMYVYRTRAYDMYLEKNKHPEAPAPRGASLLPKQSGWRRSPKEPPPAAIMWGTRELTTGKR